MTDIPIIFSAAMVRALLDGRKTMTRRLAWRELNTTKKGRIAAGLGKTASPWQRVKAGDRLWVREAVKADPDADGWDGVRYLADDAWIGSTATTADEADNFLSLYHYGKKLGAGVPSIHMPRWVSRLTLIVTATKIERLQAISMEDCLAEGIPPITDTARWTPPIPKEPNLLAIYGGAFCKLWCGLHGDDAWESNPEVVAVSFRIVKANIDAPEAMAA